MQSLGTHPLHPLSKLVHIVDDLRLNEIGARIHLLGESNVPEIEGVSKGISRSADIHPRLNRHLITALKLLLVPHILYDFDKLNRIQVINTLGFRMIAKDLMITCKT